ncbi:MAG TPA: hypothetical protein VGH74_04280 [Planctomycetaceae bacterium]|jgi:hypothetical protein
MQVSGGGPLGVLLMIAPLAAIPVFAILGVPHFAPVSASGADDDDFAVLGEPDSRAPAVSAPETAPARAANDVYAAAAESPQGVAGAKASMDQERRPLAASAVAGRSRGSGRWLPPSDALDQWEVRTDVAHAASPSRDDDAVDTRAGMTVDGFEGLESATDEPDDGLVSADGFNPDLLKPDLLIPGRDNQSKNNRARVAVDAPLELPSERRSGVRTAGATAPARGTETGRGTMAAADLAESAGALAQSIDEQSGWQDAARRLKKLGIRKYRLESRIDEQNFVFTCALASPDNPQVIRRFEADADNPLEAVEQVLEQIDEWRSRNGNAGQTESTE